MKNFLKQDTLILVLVGITISAFGIMVPILYSPTELGATNINNSIQFLILLVGIVTIAYVMKTFQLQRKELDDNKKDVEFNRASDLVYKQLEYTNNILKDLEIGVINDLHNDLNEIRGVGYRQDYFRQNSSEVLEILRIVNHILSPYRIIINASIIGDKNANLLKMLLRDNLGNLLISEVLKLQIIFEQAFGEYQNTNKMNFGTKSESLAMKLNTIHRHFKLIDNYFD